MKPPVPELSRIILAARIPNLGSFEKVKADAKELLALAKRFDVPAVHSITAGVRVSPWRGGGLKVIGDVNVSLDRVSVISLEIFTTKQKIEIERFILAPGQLAPEDSDEDFDVIANGEIDLGEIIAECVALELEPYPRAPGESFEEPDPAPPEEPKKVSAFQALKKLQK